MESTLTYLTLQASSKDPYLNKRGFFASFVSSKPASSHQFNQRKLMNLTVTFLLAKLLSYQYQSILVVVSYQVQLDILEGDVFWFPTASTKRESELDTTTWFLKIAGRKCIIYMRTHRQYCPDILYSSL